MIHECNDDQPGMRERNNTCILSSISSSVFVINTLPYSQCIPTARILDLSQCHEPGTLAVRTIARQVTYNIGTFVMQKFRVYYLSSCKKQRSAQVAYCINNLWRETMPQKSKCPNDKTRSKEAIGHLESGQCTHAMGKCEEQKRSKPPLFDPSRLAVREEPRKPGIAANR